jgi:S-adenosylmethionine synthetase
VQPVSVRVDTFGTGRVDDARIAEALREVFDFSPGRIIEELQLRTPIFRPTAAYGHFGRAVESRRVNGTTVQLFPWESTDRAADLRTAVGE